MKEPKVGSNIYFLKGNIMLIKPASAMLDGFISTGREIWFGWLHDQLISGDGAVLLNLTEEHDILGCELTAYMPALVYAKSVLEQADYKVHMAGTSRVAICVN